MATSVISALTLVLASNLSDAAVFPVDDSGGNTRKVTVAQLRTQINTGAQVFTAGATFGGGLVMTTINASSTILQKSASMSNNILIGPLSNFTSYGSLSFNNATASTTIIGLFADSASAADLWVTAASGGVVQLAVAGSARCAVSATGIVVTGTGAFSGAFGCNGNAAQTKYASGGTLSGVVAALIANGILSS